MTTKDACYVLNLKLDIELFQEHTLEKRFEIGRHIYNSCKGKMKDNLESMFKDEEFQFWLKEKKSKVRSNKLNEIRENYDVSKTGAERIVKNMGKHFLQKKPKNDKHKQKVHLDSLVVQKIALNVWGSVSDYLFKPGTKKIHFKKFGDFNSLEGKNNVSGLKYANGILHWNGLQLKVMLPKPGDDPYLEAALHDDISYCRIVRKLIRGRNKYTLQLILKGVPLQKQSPVKADVGIDIGISTVAIVSNDKIDIREFCEGLDELANEKRILLRKMDRSRRATNPHKYNDDGSIKKGNTGKWVRSKRYWKTLFELKEISRRIAAIREQMHNILANQVLKTGDHIFVENMSFKALQMGWFGKQIGIKAPSLFLSILNRKLGYQGKKLNVVNTWTVKASQYCPISDTYVKKLLSLRFHTLPNGRKIQRDIFSAWLIKNVNGSLSKVNRDKCLKEFDSFYKKYKTIEVKMRSSKKKHIASIGF